MNAAHMYLGVTDVSISKQGMAELLKAKRHPEVKRVFVSPMFRVLQTANVLFPNAEKIVVDGLREMDFGDFEGRSGKDMESEPEYRRWIAGKGLGACPNGESILEFCMRIVSAFDHVIEQAVGDEKVYIVAHGGTIMAAMSMFTGTIEDYYSFRVQNLRGYSAVLDERGWKTGHRFESYREYSALDE